MNKPVLNAADFVTDQEVRWCPGCGDYAILKAVRASLAQIGRQPHDVVFVSGIGCAARFPYYINTYGFHTIHGRAPAIASGIKLANPALDVWVIGGDGDLLSIGGNHLIHTLRRDIDLNILLFNNAIYGLTKGQYSPTSPVGTRSPSSPTGSEDQPVNAALLALASGASFVARSADTMLAELGEVIQRAHGHQGASFVEIFQNCIVYNDNVWDGLAKKATRDDKAVIVKHGKPLVFGKDNEKGLVWKAAQDRFEVIDDVPEKILQDATIFDQANFAQASALVRMDEDEYPVALGVLYCKPGHVKNKSNPSSTVNTLNAENLQRLLNGNESWIVGD